MDWEKKKYVDYKGKTIISFNEWYYKNNSAIMFLDIYKRLYNYNLNKEIKYNNFINVKDTKDYIQTNEEIFSERLTLKDLFFFSLKGTLIFKEKKNKSFNVTIKFNDKFYITFSSNEIFNRKRKYRNIKLYDRYNFIFLYYKNIVKNIELLYETATFRHSTWKQLFIIPFNNEFQSHILNILGTHKLFYKYKKDLLSNFSKVEIYCDTISNHKLLFSWLEYLIKKIYKSIFIKIIVKKKKYVFEFRKI